MENFTDVKYILDGFLFVFAGILVMWMAAGFAMLEAGLTRTKNNATVLTKNMALFAISCIMFYFIGYNLMYGEGSAFIGSGAMLSGKTDAERHDQPRDSRHAGSPDREHQRPAACGHGLRQQVLSQPRV